MIIVLRAFFHNHLEAMGFGKKWVDLSKKDWTQNETVSCIIDKHYLFRP